LNVYDAPLVKPETTCDVVDPVVATDVPGTVVSKRLGQVSIALMADVYSHCNAEMQSDAAQRGLAEIRGASSS
jgi:hypothetical protein